MRVVITGAAGNLGTKLRAHLEMADWCSSIVGIDPKPIETSGKCTGVVADLRDSADARWIEPVEAADAVVHFAAQNPWPDSAWWEAAMSMDMTLNLLAHTGHRPSRFIFASSNHVMGGYKDAPLPTGEYISSSTPPRPGTRFFNGSDYQTPTAYGGSKLLGERAVIARAASSLMSGVNIRIGWVQPGENRPETIDPFGGGTRVGDKETPPDEITRALPWFRGMWLSNDDFVQLFERALTTSADTWPSRAITVPGVSGNAETRWNLDETRTLLGYIPRDGIA